MLINIIFKIHNPPSSPLPKRSIKKKIQGLSARLMYLIKKTATHWVIKIYKKRIINIKKKLINNYSKVKV